MSTLDDIKATTLPHEIIQILKMERAHLKPQILNIDELESKIEKLEKLKKIVDSPDKGEKVNSITFFIMELRQKLDKIKSLQNDFSKGGKRKSRKTNRKSLRKRKNTLTKRRYRK